MQPNQKANSRMPDFKELVRRISFVDVLSRYNLLEQMTPNGDQLRSICPIPSHSGAKNKTSFSVNKVRNCFKCFSCGCQGNILDFVAAMENCSKYQAGRFLEKWFPVGGSTGGVDKPAERVQEKEKGHGLAGGTGDDKDCIAGNKDSKGNTAKGSQSEINPPLTFTLKNLDTTHPYLLERAQAETIKQFGLGFCAKGLMAGRVVIPIHNERGELVAYAGRAINQQTEKKEGKYKLPVAFKKGHVVFNLYRAKDLAKDKGLILVEGFFDCLKVWQAGFKNVVALMGSSLSPEQESLVLGAVGPQGKIVLMFDEDSAGQTCRNDVLIRLVSYAYVKIVNLPEESQPDMLSEDVIKELLGKC